MWKTSILSYKSYITLPVLRGYINKLRSPVKGVAMEIKKLFNEIETSSEPIRTSNYVRYLGLQHFEPGMQYYTHEYLLQLLIKIYVLTTCLRLIN